MTHSPTYSDDFTSTSAKPGSYFEAFLKTNPNLRLFGDASPAPEPRVEKPPSRYRPHIITPGPSGVLEDTPELLRKLEENARMLPFLWEEYQEAAFAALPQKEKQRLIDQRNALRRRWEERRRKREEAIDRLFAPPPTDGTPVVLFAAPKNKTQPPRSVSPEVDNHPTPTETIDKKRKRETENNIDFLAPSDSPKSDFQACKRACTGGADMQLNPAQHAELQDEPVKYSVGPDENIPSGKAVAEPPSPKTTAEPPSAPAVVEPPSAPSIAEPPSALAVAKPPSAPAVAEPPLAEAVAEPPSAEVVAEPSSAPIHSKVPESTS